MESATTPSLSESELQRDGGAVREGGMEGQ